MSLSSADPAYQDTQVKKGLRRTGGTTAQRKQFQEDLAIQREGEPLTIDEIPFPELESGGSGGGGGGTGGASNLINQRKRAAIDLATGQYNDQMKALDDAEKFARTETERGRQTIGTQRDLVIDDAKKNQQSNARLARQAYQDSIVATRRRTRAVGGAGSSGFLELTNLLDQELSSNLNSVNENTASIIGKAQSVAQTALSDLESSLQKQLNMISNDRLTSRREKDAAIKQAELAAADQAYQIQQWYAKASSAKASAANQQAMANYQNQVMNAYLGTLSKAQAGQVNATPEQIRAGYASQLLNAGFSPQNINSYGQLIDPNLGASNNGVNTSVGQISPYQYIQSLGNAYDPYTQSYNPLTLQLLGLDPNLYNAQ